MRDRPSPLTGVVLLATALVCGFAIVGVAALVLSLLGLGD